jgi:hypothetical protein
MLREHRHDLGIVELNYAEGPATGPPLVVLHGGSARSKLALGTSAWYDKESYS